MSILWAIFNWKFDGMTAPVLWHKIREDEENTEETEDQQVGEILLTKEDPKIVSVEKKG